MQSRCKEKVSSANQADRADGTGRFAPGPSLIVRALGASKRCPGPT